MLDSVAESSVALMLQAEPLTLLFFQFQSGQSQVRTAEVHVFAELVFAPDADLEDTLLHDVL